MGLRGTRIPGEWRKLHIEGLKDLYGAPNNFRVTKIKKNEMGRACSIYGGGEWCI